MAIGKMVAKRKGHNFAFASVRESDAKVWGRRYAQTMSCRKCGQPKFVVDGLPCGGRRG